MGGGGGALVPGGAIATARDRPPGLAPPIPWGLEVQGLAGLASRGSDWAVFVDVSLTTRLDRHSGRRCWLALHSVHTVLFTQY